MLEWFTLSNGWSICIRIYEQGTERAHRAWGSSGVHPRRRLAPPIVAPVPLSLTEESKGDGQKVLRNYLEPSGRWFDWHFFFLFTSSLFFIRRLSFIQPFIQRCIQHFKYEWSNLWYHKYTKIIYTRNK